MTHYLNYDPKKECIKSDGSRGYCAPTVFPGARDVLYHNEGNGTFTDVSLQAGIQAAAEPGLGVICADFNEDGLPDFYVANDEGANLLWINQGKKHIQRRGISIRCRLERPRSYRSGYGAGRRRRGR